MLGRAGCDEEEIAEVINNAKERSKTRINYSDFLAATLTSKVNLSEDIIRGAFRTFDIDKSGDITVQDLRTALAKAGKDFSKDEVTGMIEELGVANNRINYEAFRKMLKTLPVV